MSSSLRLSKEERRRLVRELRLEVGRQRDPTNPLYMNAVGRLLHRAAAALEGDGVEDAAPRTPTG